MLSCLLLQLRSALLPSLIIRPTYYATWWLQKVMSAMGPAFARPGRFPVCNGPWMTLKEAGQRLSCQQCQTMRERIAQRCAFGVISYPWLIWIVFWLLEGVEFLDAWCNCSIAGQRMYSWPDLEWLLYRWQILSGTWKSALFRLLYWFDTFRKRTVPRNCRHFSVSVLRRAIHQMG